MLIRRHKKTTQKVAEPAVAPKGGKQVKKGTKA